MQPYLYFPIYLKMVFSFTRLLEWEPKQDLHSTYHIKLCFQSLNFEKFLEAMNSLRILIRRFSFKFMSFSLNYHFFFYGNFSLFFFFSLMLQAVLKNLVSLLICLNLELGKNISLRQLTGFNWGCLLVRTLLASGNRIIKVA